MTFFTTTEILDGKKVSDNLLGTISQELAALKTQGAVLPKLVVILVDDDPASQVYVGKKAKTARKLGMESDVITLPGDTDQATLQGEIRKLNLDPSVHGILVQLPLPKHMNTFDVIMTVSPEKDVDGLHPLSLGRLMAGDATVCKPCTPAGILTLLKAYKVPLAGKHAVVVGRSNIVGKPMGMLLLQEHCTVTYCHSRTEDLSAVTRQADILIAAVGIPRMIKADDVKPGVVVVDVGINRVDGRLCGDVDFDSVSPKASFITPVPGGVGPMTIATLMANTLALYRNSLAR